MMKLAVLISPVVKGAFFAEYLQVCRTELETIQTEGLSHTQVGGLDFFHMTLSPEDVPRLARLSCVQGLFERVDGALIPLDVSATFRLHSDFVFGTKYRGKTNEVLTQFMLNLGLAHLQPTETQKVTLLDPMCGRGTTLLWALRYGLWAKGIEQDHKALSEMRQSVKKWCKIHRQKHEFSEGFVGKSNPKKKGKFIRFSLGECGFQATVGDAAECRRVLNGERFSLIVSDLPYGVQHVTTPGTRNPLETLTRCAPAWSESLKPGGVMVLAYNQYQPKREHLIDLLTEYGLVEAGTPVPHRMSESILRDVIVLKKPKSEAP